VGKGTFYYSGFPISIPRPNLNKSNAISLIKVVHASPQEYAYI
jgi:hypothetical protein